MNPSYAIVLWMIIGGVAGWWAGRRRDVAAHRADAGCVVAGIIGAVSGGSLVELALRDDPGRLGFAFCLVVALLGALVGQAVAPRLHPPVT